jgi:uncharacterized protein
MNNRSRITSILHTPTLDASVTGLPTFDLSELNLESDYNFPIPTDVRLGHVAEHIVSTLIKSSANYEVLYEHVQLIENNRTIGEIDFILSNRYIKEVIHVELGYKFFLYDPGISSDIVNNWIGPNRNDSLKEKLDKVKHKQFPLLYHEALKSKLDKVKPEEITQKLCLLVSLFVPYSYDNQLPSAYQQATKGYYLRSKDFFSLDHSEKTYYIPPKLAWGIDPAENSNWKSFRQIEAHIQKSMAEKRALLCWQKHQDTYSTFFIVWW